MTDTPRPLIADLNLSARARNALAFNGITRLKDLVQMTETELKRLDGLGRRSAEDRATARAVYSITSSARSSIDGGTARPSAVAVLRFTTIPNLVGN
jgi:hypothetical protein